MNTAELYTEANPHHRCTRCHTYLAVYQVLLEDEAEYERVCANCLSQPERFAIDAGRREAELARLSAQEVVETMGANI